MAVEYYCTATEVKEKVLGTYITSAGWVDANINTRIVEAQNIIESILSVYYTVPFDKGASTPPIINVICKMMARYHCLRDLIEEKIVPVDDNRTYLLSNRWKKDAEQYINEILGVTPKGGVSRPPRKILDTSGDEIARTTKRLIHSSTADIGRIFTMDDEINQKVDDEHSEEPVIKENQ